MQRQDVKGKSWVLSASPLFQIILSDYAHHLSFISIYKVQVCSIYILEGSIG